jgi:hypothetical protein
MTVFDGSAVLTGLANHAVVFRPLTESSAQGELGRGAVMPGGAHGRTNVARHWSEWTALFGGHGPNLLSQHGGPKVVVTTAGRGNLRRMPAPGPRGMSGLMTSASPYGIDNDWSNL